MTLWGGFSSTAAGGGAIWAVRPALRLPSAEARSRGTPCAAADTISAVEASSCGCAAPTRKKDMDVVCISGIAERHLKKSMGSPLTIHLVDAEEAADDVREMVRKEQYCCAFPRLDLSVGKDGVHLLITTSKAAKGPADVLFDHLAPKLAHAPAA